MRGQYIYYAILEALKIREESLGIGLDSVETRDTSPIINCAIFAAMVTKTNLSSSDEMVQIRFATTAASPPSTPSLPLWIYPQCISNGYVSNGVTSNGL